MREIKFRAWNTKLEKWIDDIDLSMDGVVVLNTAQTFGGAYGHEPILMQYTGLKDKNGKEIYEGDIVKKGDGLLYEMRFRKDFARFEFMSIHLINDGNRKWCGIYGYPTPYDKEPDEEIGIIIGNIHENPELLDKQ